MKTHISFYALALTALLSFSGCAASDSGALSDFTAGYPSTAEGTADPSQDAAPAVSGSAEATAEAALLSEQPEEAKLT